MTVRYIRVDPISEMFAPAVRAFGNIAIIGAVTPPAVAPEPDPEAEAPDPWDVPVEAPAIAALNEPILFTNPAEALARCPGTLGDSIALAFTQSPGPTVIWGVRSEAATIQTALDKVATLDVQIVVLAGVNLDASSAAGGNNPGAIMRLRNHVMGVSLTGGDGHERIGVAMLPKGVSDPSIVSGKLASERMTYVAHKSDEDAAAAVAGTIAGYEPHISLLLKKVNISSESFTASEINQLNGTENPKGGPAGLGVNWLIDPPLIPGSAVHMGEGYTGDPGGGKKYIDIVRTMDDVTFRLKATLIKMIGSLRISRSGLRALSVQIESILNGLVQSEVIEGFVITIPTLILLDKDPASLTPAEAQAVQDAQAQRVVEVVVSVDYAGAIHRLAVTLKFQ